MNRDELNKLYRQQFYENKTKENLEKYILSEIYSPISDYENAARIIRCEEPDIVSEKLKLIEAYLSYTELFTESYCMKELEKNIELVEDDIKSLIYYIKSFNTAEKERIIEFLNLSIEYDSSSVSNYLRKSELVNTTNERNILKQLSYNNIRKIYSEYDCDTVLDNEYFFNIENYINAEIKMIEMTKSQVLLIFEDVK